MSHCVTKTKKEQEVERSICVSQNLVEKQHYDVFSFEVRVKSVASSVWAVGRQVRS